MKLHLKRFIQYSSHVTSRASASDSHLNCERVTFYTRAWILALARTLHSRVILARVLHASTTRARVYIATTSTMCHIRRAISSGPVKIQLVNHSIVNIVV